MSTNPRLAAVIVCTAVLVGLTCAAATAGPSTPRATAVAAAQTAPTYQPAAETTYVPITPCRIVDTRVGTGVGGTPLAPSETRSFRVGGTAGFPGQGGRAAGCGIPVGAGSIAATLSAVSPTRAGFLRAWPSGLSEPTATQLNYSGASITTGVTLSITTTTAVALTVKNYGGPTELVVDVTGYYVAPLAGTVSANGTAYAGSSRITATARTGVGSYQVTFDRDIRYCAAVATAYGSGLYASADTFVTPDPSTVVVRLFDSAGAPADQFFYLHVAC